MRKRTVKLWRLHDDGRKLYAGTIQAADELSRWHRAATRPSPADFRCSRRKSQGSMAAPSSTSLTRERERGTFASSSSCFHLQSGKIDERRSSHVLAGSAFFAARENCGKPASDLALRAHILLIRSCVACTPSGSNAFKRPALPREWGTFFSSHVRSNIRHRSRLASRQAATVRQLGPPGKRRRSR